MANSLADHELPHCAMQSGSMLRLEEFNGNSLI